MIRRNFMEIGLVRKIDIDNEMQQAYLDYAMSVIVARALPDARDGLKPVHRRILYAMHDMGLRPDSGYKKSARIVGEVLGKYHPHGDAAVYEAMARMAQDFSMRYMPVDGQGNFGSVDGDPPAAMRYTEARLAAMAGHMLADIHKNTVNFVENFDGTLREPEVLPSALPNMLINGATGIAVGMATSIPPHNLREVVDALVHLLKNWNKMDDIPVDDLMQFVQGPDFPTGGVILQDDGEDSLSTAYATGRGRVTVQARAMVEEMTRGRNRIVVTELPYMTNKAGLIERIASLVREEKIEGIADLRDESDRQGMRIVIELTKTGKPEKVLQDLYKSTPMRNTFSIIMLALVDGEPRMLGLKQALRVYLEHRLEVVRRRSEHDLERARHRAHILEGLRVALKNLDEVIALIRKAPDADTAKTRLVKRFKLTDIQAQAILDMQLRRLATLERKKIEEEYKEVLATIKLLEGLLRSPKKMRDLVAEELLAVKETYGDIRRTQIVRVGAGETKVAVLSAQDFVEEKNIFIMISREGLLARTPEDKLPRMSGKNAPVTLVKANTRNTLYLVADNGEAAALPVHLVPECNSIAEGVDYWKISPLNVHHKLAAAIAMPSRDERMEGFFILSATREGMVKKSAVIDLPGPSAHTFTLMRVNEGDQLGWVMVTNGKEDVLLVTKAGMAIRFAEEQVRSMGLVAAGVAGIKLQKGDCVIGVLTLPERGHVLLLLSDGTAKRVAINQFPKQNRYGRGVIVGKLLKGVGLVGVAKGKGSDRVILHLVNSAAKAIRLDEAPEMGRAARGKKVIKIKPDDSIDWLVEVGQQLDIDVIVKDDSGRRLRGPSKRIKKTGKGAASSPEVGIKSEQSTKLPGKTGQGLPKTSAKSKKDPKGRAAKTKTTRGSTKATRGAKSSAKAATKTGKVASEPAAKVKTTRGSAKAAKDTKSTAKVSTKTGKVAKASAAKTKSTRGAAKTTKGAKSTVKEATKTGKVAKASAAKTKATRGAVKTTKGTKSTVKEATKTGKVVKASAAKTKATRGAAKTTKGAKSTVKEATKTGKVAKASASKTKATRGAAKTTKGTKSTVKEATKTGKVAKAPAARTKATRGAAKTTKGTKSTGKVASKSDKAAKAPAAKTKATRGSTKTTKGTNSTTKSATKTGKAAKTSVAKTKPSSKAIKTTKTAKSASTSAAKPAKTAKKSEAKSKVSGKETKKAKRTSTTSKTSSKTTKGTKRSLGRAKPSTGTVKQKKRAVKDSKKSPGRRKKGS
jgi:DNA gyrase subunit A